MRVFGAPLKLDHLRLGQREVAATQYSRFCKLLTKRSANAATKPRAFLFDTSDNTESPNEKYTRQENPRDARATSCAYRSVVIQKWRKAVRCLRPLAHSTFPVGPRWRVLDIRKARALNNGSHQQAERSNSTKAHLEAVEGAWAAAGWSLKRRQRLAPNVPAVLGPDRLPCLDGLISNPFLTCLDRLDG